jgi:hypothetical protein
MNLGVASLNRSSARTTVVSRGARHFARSLALNLTGMRRAVALVR